MKIRRILTILICGVMLMASMSVAAFADEVDETPYNQEEVAAIQAIIESNAFLKETYKIDDPASWEQGEHPLANWQAVEISKDAIGNPVYEYRLYGLSLEYDDFSTDEYENYVDFSGTLDLSMFTDLGWVECDYNPNLTSIKLPEGNSLFKVACSNTGITELNLSNNPGLEDLHCANTRITSLVLSGNPALRELYCYETDISALDVSNNPNLVLLSCYDTSIEVLDVTKNPALERLECDRTNITTLDVSENPNLSVLWCADTELSELNVSNNSKLENLDCYNTNITVLDLSNNSCLIHLNHNSIMSQIITTQGQNITIIQPAGGIIECSFDPEGNKLILHAAPDDGYQFMGYTGLPESGVDYGQDFIYLTVTDDRTISAKFALAEKSSDENINTEDSAAKGSEDSVPETGDETNAGALAILMLMAAMMAGSAVVVRRKQ